MTNYVIKLARLMVPILLFFLFSCASTQQKHGEIGGPNIYYERGNKYYHEGQNDQAISNYNKALEINPRFAEAYINRGLARAKKGQWDEAVADYNKALEIDQTIALAYFNRGIAYQYKGEHNKAISDYSKALELARGVT